MFETTPRHQRIFDFLQNGAGHAAIIALAGAGKTSTMVEAAAKILEQNPETEILACAFNATIRTELAARMPRDVAVKTLNGLGWGALRSHSPRCQLNKNRTQEMIWHFLSEADANVYGPALSKLIGLAKSGGLVPDTEATQRAGAEGILEDNPENWNNLIQRFGILVPEITAESGTVTQGRLIDFARRILSEGITRGQMADFDDQLYMTVALGLPIQKFDWVIVDEAQDLSPLQHELISRALADGGRLLAVGDPNQAIYGFRGADSSSMPRLIERFSMETFSLPVSYRCPKVIAELARKHCPEFESLPNAADGQIQHLNPHQMAWDPSDLVMCRNSAPLIGLAYDLIRKGIGCQVLGRDIGAGLAAMAKRANGKQNRDLGVFEERLRRHAESQIKRLQSQEKEAQAEGVADRRDTILIILENTEATDVNGLISDIFAMFTAENGKKKDVVTLCTVHKAKGLEAPRAIILDSHLMPSRMARQDWEKEQEKNLIYVAQTRALQTLAYLETAEGQT